MSLKSINPATEEVLAEYNSHSDSSIDHILESAFETYETHYQRMAAPYPETLSAIRKVAELLENRASEYGELISREMGKPIKQARAEIEKCAGLCRYYSEQAPAFLQPSERSTESQQSYVRYDPLGPVLAIMPWNFPFWQVFRAAVPSLCAGNPVILKHASNVTGCALKVEELFQEAGLPEKMFQVLLLPGSRMPDLLEDSRIRGVTLTGSEAAGRAIASAAGQNLKKCVLELGGSDPFLILADANIQQAASVAAQARCINSGQSCIAAKRFIVEQSVAADFLDAFRLALQKLTVGDPLNAATEIGPLARQDLREDLHDQLQRSVQEGARLLLGGNAKEGPGYFYETTLVHSDSIYNIALQDETFGPLAAVISARDTEEMIEMANMSRFGLGGSVWTSDLERASEICRRLETGSVTVNDLLRSDVRMPFGGVKDSGFGREMGHEGILEFVNQKAIRINN